MFIDEFRDAQRHGETQNLSELLGACRRKFLNAARLMELDGPAIERVVAHGREAVSLWPLINMYSVACDRYCDAFFSPQVEIFPNPGESQDVTWSKYFHHVLLPHLLEDDAFVRNVLRATMAIPCESPQDAGEALVQQLTEMELPSSRPSWSPEVGIYW